MCMSFNLEGKDHRFTQKRRHYWLILAGEGWWTFSPCWVLPCGVRLWQSSLTYSDIPTGKTPDMRNQPWLHSCPAVGPLLGTAPASSITDSHFNYSNRHPRSSDCARVCFSFFEDSRVSSLLPDCKATEKSERCTDEHSTYSAQKPTKT